MFFNRLVKFFLDNRLITFLFLITFVVCGIVFAPFNWKTGLFPARSGSRGCNTGYRRKPADCCNGMDGAFTQGHTGPGDVSAYDCLTGYSGGSVHPQHIHVWNVLYLYHFQGQC